MSATAAASPTIAAPSGVHDFDFLYGRWKIAHHRLNRRLVGETAWTDFTGSSVARPLFGGLGNLDENVVELPSGPYEAATVRLFDAERQQWSIWWIDARFPDIDTPMQGAFVGGVGTFFGDDVHDGTPVRVRFRWSDITATSARWEQAFSTDGGSSWEVNWVMHFERVT